MAPSPKALSPMRGKLFLPVTAFVTASSLAQTVVLDDEDSELFATLLSTLENELCPGDETDRALIENMAVARWRLMRLWGMEKAGLCHEMEKHQSSALNSPTRAAWPFEVLATNRARSMSSAAMKPVMIDNTPAPSTCS